MKTKTLFAIRSCACLFLVQVLGSAISDGHDAAYIGDRILNGVEANPADFLYVVRLHVGDALCGGSVIHNYFILTAGHCLMYHPCSSILVFQSTWSQGAIPTSYTAECYVHQKYVYPKYFYDIGLIRTSDDLVRDGGFTIIPLPAPGTHYDPGTPAVIVGWGKNEDNFYPRRLMRADVQVEYWDTCNTAYKQTIPECRDETDCVNGDIPNRAICTKGLRPNPGASCQGDSGGPVVISGVVAAIVVGSLLAPTDRCALATPSLHSNVADFLPWIYAIIDPDLDTSQMPVIDEYY